MKYNEIFGNLFELPNDYVLAHCISADFALGAGIAAQFAQRGVRNELYDNYMVNVWANTGYCLMTTNNSFTVANLVTKEKCYHKPTYKTLAEALIDFRNQLSTPTKIGMPCIGCGLDRLNWDEVKDIIMQVFADTNHEITVCRISL